MSPTFLNFFMAKGEVFPVAMLSDPAKRDRYVHMWVPGESSTESVQGAENPNLHSPPFSGVKQIVNGQLAECIEELASSWRTWQWRLDNSTLSPPSELADRIREILDRRTYEAMRLALTLLGILE